MISLFIIRKLIEKECLVTHDNISHIYKHTSSEHKLTKDQTNIQIILLY